jgi:hypothetical protein
MNASFVINLIFACDYLLLIDNSVLENCDTVIFAHFVSVLGNRVLRIIFESKRKEVTGVWRKLYNELRDVYVPNVSDQIKEDEMIGACDKYRREEKRVLIWRKETTWKTWALITYIHIHFTDPIFASVASEYETCQ